MDFRVRIFLVHTARGSVACCVLCENCTDDEQSYISARCGEVLVLLMSLDAIKPRWSGRLMHLENILKSPGTEQDFFLNVVYHSIVLVHGGFSGGLQKDAV